MTNPDDKPTPAQYERAKRVGISFPAGTTKQMATRLLSEGPPTKEQREFAEKLGIKTDGLTADAVSKELTRVLVRLGKRALQDNPALREGASIQYEGEVFTITAIHRNSRRPSVSLRPFAGGRVKVVAAALLRDATEVNVRPLKHPNQRASGA